MDLWYEFLPSSECLARGRRCGAGAKSTRLKQGAVARNGETALAELSAASTAHIVQLRQVVAHLPVCRLVLGL